MENVEEGTQYYDYHRDMEIEYTEADDQGPHRLEVYERGNLVNLIQGSKAKELYHILTGGKVDETVI